MSLVVFASIDTGASQWTKLSLDDVSQGSLVQTSPEPEPEVASLIIRTKLPLLDLSSHSYAAMGMYIRSRGLFVWIGKRDYITELMAIATKTTSLQHA